MILELKNGLATNSNDSMLEICPNEDEGITDIHTRLRELAHIANPEELMSISSDLFIPS